MSNLPTEDYHVGIVCTLALELTAILEMLDEEYEIEKKRASQDDNTYFFGRMAGHLVVVACLPAGRTGTVSAATTAIDMLRTFGQIRFGLLVGIGGGIPNLKAKIDIRLGDVVVSEPSSTLGGVVQYDLGKDIGGVWQRLGSLNSPPIILLTALQAVKANHQRHKGRLSSYLEKMLTKNPMLKEDGYVYQGAEKDQLFSDLPNEKGETVTSEITRPSRGDRPRLHCGIIASGNRLIKNAAERDKLRQECGALCVEMEAAGLMNKFPCLVVRGISDYADVHKNDVWQPYAAAAAAALAKEVLSRMPAEEVQEGRTAVDVMGKCEFH